MVKFHISVTIEEELLDFVESFHLENVCKSVRRPTTREYGHFCAAQEKNLNPDDKNYHNKLYVINAIQAFVRRVDVEGRNHILINTSEDWWSANIINPLIEFCYFDHGLVERNVVQSTPSRNRRNRDRTMEVRVQSGNKPDFHLVDSPQLMCGEIKKDDNFMTDHKNTCKLQQEMADELEFVFNNLEKDCQRIIMNIESTGYKIQKRRVGIYIMRVLGDGVYLSGEIDNFEIPTILNDLDKLIEGIIKILRSKLRFEESIKRLNDVEATDSSSSSSVSDFPGRIIRATNHSNKHN